MPKNYNLFLKGFVGSWNFSSDMISYILDKNKDQEVHVLVDSLGGYTHEGLTISSLFQLHGNVHVHYVGMNASAATIASMGAKHISIDASAMYLVHKSMYTIDKWDDMNADNIEEYIKELTAQKSDLEKFDATVAALYARRCKKSKQELLELMKVGGWLTSQEALDWGFVDEITNNEEDEAPVIDETLATSMAAAGIPMPKNIKVQKDENGNKFIRALKRAFAIINQDDDTSDKPYPVTASTVPCPPKPEQTQEPQQAQAQQQAEPQQGEANNISQTVKLELLTSAVGADVTAESKLTAEQLNSVEAALAKSKEDKEALEKKIEELQSRIAELEKQPGATTSEVTEPGGNPKEGPSADARADANSLLKALI
jgi:ATP-dependent protease ClpP protease subunit